MWELDCEEGWALKNWCFWTVVLQKALESPLDWKEIQPVHPKGDQSWVFIGRTDVEAETNTLATWREELTHSKRLWCWERLRAGGEGDNWGWDGWMASPTQWTSVWVDSRNWWWTGRPGVLQLMRLQRVRHDWATELNWNGKTALRRCIIPGLKWNMFNTLAAWCKELTHLKRLWCWERLRVEGEGDNRGWDGWMASPTQWTSVWVDSGSWWWTGRPGVLRFMGSQSDTTERLIWSEWWF